MPRKSDFVFGQVAMQKSLVDLEEIFEALKKVEKHESDGSPRISLGEVLIETKSKKKQDTDDLRGLHDFFELNRHAKVFGKLAINNKRITEKQLDEALEVQRNAFLGGEPAPRIGKVLVNLGYMKPSVVKALLQAMEKIEAYEVKRAAAIAKHEEEPEAPSKAHLKIGVEGDEDSVEVDERVLAGATLTEADFEKELARAGDIRGISGEHPRLDDDDDDDSIMEVTVVDDDDEDEEEEKKKPEVGAIKTQKLDKKPSDDDDDDEDEFDEEEDEDIELSDDDDAEKTKAKKSDKEDKKDDKKKDKDKKKEDKKEDKKKEEKKEKKGLFGKLFSKVPKLPGPDKIVEEIEEELLEELLEEAKDLAEDAAKAKLEEIAEEIVDEAIDDVLGDNAPKGAIRDKLVSEATKKAVDIVWKKAVKELGFDGKAKKEKESDDEDDEDDDEEKDEKKGKKDKGSSKLEKKPLSGKLGKKKDDDEDSDDDDDDKKDKKDSGKSDAKKKFGKFASLKGKGKALGKKK
ncbi:MAG: hypothetical protein NUW37_19655 [Planctomycetes bacterium]|nr:hypothetical protein [Planctomycetota bacterium]